MAGKNRPEPFDIQSGDLSTRQAVGIVSTSRTGLYEVGSLLAREGVGVSMSIGVDAGDLDADRDGQGMLTGLKTLQDDAVTEAIVLVAGIASPDAARGVLAQVRSSDKPTVICFVGVDRHLAWRAGAIPASRMDEASMRAAAWVRGWDQALISSRLEDLDEALQVQARALAGRIGPDRRSLAGLFTSGLFCHEAQLMLAECASPVPQASFRDLGAEEALEDRFQLVHQALARPEAALVLLDLDFDRRELSHLEHALTRLPRESREKTLVLAHICGELRPTEEDLDRLAELEAELAKVGIVTAHSNAAAARLAGMILAAR